MVSLEGLAVSHVVFDETISGCPLFYNELYW